VGGPPLACERRVATMVKVKVKNGNAKAKAKAVLTVDLDESHFVSLRAQFEDIWVKTMLVASGLDASTQCSQVLLRGLYLAEELAKRVETLADELQAKVLAHADAQGAFEAGTLAVQIAETSRRNVRWKDEAIATGEALAKEQGKDWDVKQFEETVSSKYPKSTSRKVKLIEVL